jgi:hypothetical protein
MVYDTAQMGEKAIGFLQEKVGDQSLRGDLQTQYRQYADISNKVENEMGKKGKMPKQTNPVSQAGLWSGIQVNTLVNRSSDHIASMMIQGSMMGVIEMSRALKEFSDVAQESKNLGQELIQMEENNVQRMKQYLGDKKGEQQH